MGAVVDIVGSLVDDPFKIYEVFNRVEGIAWFVIAAALPFFVRSSTVWQRICVLAASAGFVLFGISDFLEATTQGRLPAWLWRFKIFCAAFILSCRYSYLGWQYFKLTDRYFLFGVFCLAASFGAIYLQDRLSSGG